MTADCGGGVLGFSTFALAVGVVLSPPLALRFGAGGAVVIGGSSSPGGVFAFGGRPRGLVAFTGASCSDSSTSGIDGQSVESKLAKLATLRARSVVACLAAPRNVLAVSRRRTLLASADDAMLASLIDGRLPSSLIPSDVFTAVVAAAAAAGGSPATGAAAVAGGGGSSSTAAAGSDTSMGAAAAAMSCPTAVAVTPAAGGVVVPGILPTALLGGDGTGLGYCSGATGDLGVGGLVGVVGVGPLPCALLPLPL